MRANNPENGLYVGATLSRVPIPIYETKGDELLGPRVIPTGENGHGALAGILDALGVEVLICGGIGGGAQMALDEIGVKVIGGASGNVDEVVKGFIAGTLNTRSDFSCHHHEHDANHRCGDHGCGVCSEGRVL